MRSATARDSFAYISYWGANRRFLRVLDVSDPSNPQFAAEESCRNVPEDLVLRDTLVYSAQSNAFMVHNVARPREPVLVGSCNTTDGVYFGLVVEDTLAYLVGDYFQVINIADPSAPYIESSNAGGAAGLAVQDTFAYIPNGWDSVRVYSVANPAAPRRLASVPCGIWPWDAAVGDSTLFVATSDGWGVDVYDISNPGQPVRTGRASAPTDIRRLHYSDGLLYAALWDAGVAIYETTQTGVFEPGKSPGAPGAFSVRPNPVARWCLLEVPTGGACAVVARDVTGRAVDVPQVREERHVQTDMGNLPSGIYFLEVQSAQRREVVKVTKR